MIQNWIYCFEPTWRTSCFFTSLLQLMKSKSCFLIHRFEPKWSNSCFLIRNRNRKWLTCFETTGISFPISDLTLALHLSKFDENLLRNYFVRKLTWILKILYFLCITEAHRVAEIITLRVDQNLPILLWQVSCMVSHVRILQKFHGLKIQHFSWDFHLS